MGKASSSKKVARAAGISGGRTHRRNTPWGYFGIIVLILVLGVAGTWQSRNARLHKEDVKTKVQPTVGTTWNEGYAVYLCGKFANPIAIKTKTVDGKLVYTSPSDPEGITTRAPGIINIHPTTNAAAGKNAVLGKFSSAVGMTLNAAEIQLPGGKQYVDGDSCEGKPGHVYVKQFAYIGDATGQLFNGAKGELAKLDPRFVPLADQLLLTIAFVPADKAASIPPPPAYVNANLKKLEPVTTTTTLPATTTTTAPAKSTTTTTTKKASTTTTTAKP